LHVFGVVVSNPILPALPEDADPFESQCANDRIEVLVSPLVMSDKSFGPVAVFPAFSAPLIQGLSQEAVAAHAAEDPAAFTTLIGDGSHAAEGGEAGGVLAMGSMLSEGGEEPGGQGGTGSGEVLEEGVFGVLEAELLNGQIVFLDRPVEDFDLVEDEVHLQPGRFDDVGIVGERDEIFDDGETLLEPFLATAAMAVEEGFQGAFPRTHEGLRGGPAAQEVEVHRSPDVLVEHENGLGVIAFEECLQAVGKGGALVDKAAPGFAEGLEATEVTWGDSRRSELGVMPIDEVSDVAGVGLIGSGAGDHQRLPVGPGGGGIEAVEGDPDLRGEEGDQVGRRLFEGHGDTGVGEAVPQLGPPLVEGLGRGGDGFFGSLPGGWLEGADGESGIGAVDADDQVEGLFWSLKVHRFSNKVLSGSFAEEPTTGDGNRVAVYGTVL
jgi:hypothetical protein